MDVTQIIKRLAQPCQLVLLDSVDSTNDEVRRRQADDLARETPLVVVSQRQSAGRGRLGRRWESPAGGLYISLLLRGVSPTVNSTLSLVVALGVYDALVEVVPGVTVKWPNDLLVPIGQAMDDKACAAGNQPADRVIYGKLGGILTESAQLGYLVVGIGINLQRPVIGGFDSAVYIAELASEPVASEQVTAAILNSVLQRWQAWLVATGDFRVLAADYRQALLLPVEPISVRSANGELIASGQAVGIDDGGRLLLQGTAGQQAIAVGEVTLRQL